MKHFLTLLLCLVASLTAGAVPTTPTFSTEDGEATWYYIRFKSNYNCYLTDCGVGNNVQVMGFDLARADDQQWKVVGESTTSFTLVNKAGIIRKTMGLGFSKRWVSFHKTTRIFFEGFSHPSFFCSEL